MTWVLIVVWLYQIYISNIECLIIREVYQSPESRKFIKLYKYIYAKYPFCSNNSTDGVHCDQPKASEYSTKAKNIYFLGNKARLFSPYHIHGSKTQHSIWNVEFWIVTRTQSYFHTWPHKFTLSNWLSLLLTLTLTTFHSRWCSSSWCSLRKLDPVTEFPKTTTSAPCCNSCQKWRI